MPDTVKSALLRYMEIFSAIIGSSSMIRIFSSLILILLLEFVLPSYTGQYAFPRRRRYRCKSTVVPSVFVQMLLSVLYQMLSQAAWKNRAENHRHCLSL